MPYCSLENSNNEQHNQSYINIEYFITIDITVFCLEEQIKKMDALKVNSPTFWGHYNLVFESQIKSESCNTLGK